MKIYDVSINGRPGGELLPEQARSPDLVQGWPRLGRSPATVKRRRREGDDLPSRAHEQRHPNPEKGFQ